MQDTDYPYKTDCPKCTGTMVSCVRTSKEKVLEVQHEKVIRKSVDVYYSCEGCGKNFVRIVESVNEEIITDKLEEV